MKTYMPLYFCKHELRDTLLSIGFCLWVSPNWLTQYKILSSHCWNFQLQLTPENLFWLILRRLL